MRLARVLRIGVDPLEVGLGADAFDLELRHERAERAAGVDDDGDGPFGGEEVEAGEVADVGGVEEHDTGEAVGMREEPGPPLGMLGGADPGHGG